MTPSSPFMDIGNIPSSYQSSPSKASSSKVNKDDFKYLTPTRLSRVNLKLISDIANYLLSLTPDTDRNSIFRSVTDLVKEENLPPSGQIIHQLPSDAKDAPENFPFHYVLTRDRIHFIEKKVGQGTFTNVYKTKVFIIQPHEINGNKVSPGDIFDLALKVSISSGGTFSPDKRALKGIDMESLEFLDCPLVTFKVINGLGFALNVFFNADLNHTHFHLMENPVATFLNVSICYAKGLRFLHKHSQVHRDIKGGNLLVSGSQGVITDFGSLMLESKSVHRTHGTPPYIDPRCFTRKKDRLIGNSENNILNQQLFEGKQKRKSDVFSFGMTFLRDFLIPFIREKSKLISPNAPIELGSLITKEFQPKFSKGKLEDVGRKTNYRIMYSYQKIKKGEIQEKSEVLYIFPELKILREALVNACNLLKPVLSQEEVIALTELSKLSCSMQELTNRPTIEEVQSQLEQVLQTLQARPSTSDEYESVPSSTGKRSRKDSESEDLVKMFNHHLKELKTECPKSDPVLPTLPVEDN